MMERLVVILPALAVAAYFFIAWFIYLGLWAVGRRPQSDENRKHSAFFYIFIDYFLWILRPIERALQHSKISPNQITVAGMTACAISGLAIATGHLATAGWLYVLAGALDILDGRLARHQGKSTLSGGFLDSVTDRVGELFVFAGFAWFLRDTVWLIAVMACIAGSLMVSYTRAKGESLGIKLDGGNMQRAERIALISIGTLVTAWFNATRADLEIGTIVISTALTIVAVGSVIAALSRFMQGYRQLKALDKAAGAAEPDADESIRLSESKA